MKRMWPETTLLVILAVISEASVRNFDGDNTLTPRFINKDLPELAPNVATVSDEEYIRHFHSMINAYRDDLGERLVIETNALVDTKYRTWKRNADLINSLLALPKGMNDAGR